MNLQQILTSHPLTNQIDCFELRKAPLPSSSSLLPNQLLLQTKYLSIDATNKIWISGQKSHMDPVKLEAPMHGLAIAEVLFSTSEKFAEGDLVMGLFHWQLYSVIDSSQAKKLPKS